MALLREREASRFGSTEEREASALASARFERAAAVARDLRAAKRAARSIGGGVADAGGSMAVVSSCAGGGESVVVVPSCGGDGEEVGIVVSLCVETIKDECVVAQSSPNGDISVRLKAAALITLQVVTATG